MKPLKNWLPSKETLLLLVKKVELLHVDADLQAETSSQQQTSKSVQVEIPASVKLLLS